ncbi:addiction module protein [Nitratifractor sp.]|uniref:addiction module protein n=1 Tax=Nitratifractor sp. TaxID=2268144 RepID=UPI0025D420B6|nr:addiction module protein [Nitratifractor sp.]
MSVEELEKLSVDERLRMMEALWKSLERTPEILEVQDWHRKILEERASKNGKLYSLDEVKEHLRSEFYDD